jgi:hypothetical protein
MLVGAPDAATFGLPEGPSDGISLLGTALGENVCAKLGCSDNKTVVSSLGPIEGYTDGRKLGLLEGRSEGVLEGDKEGAKLGSPLGAVVGTEVGCDNSSPWIKVDGDPLGLRDGCNEGRAEGKLSLGCALGEFVGTGVGLADGNLLLLVVMVGSKEGNSLGSLEFPSALVDCGTRAGVPGGSKGLTDRGMPRDGPWLLLGCGVLSSDIIVVGTALGSLLSSLLPALLSDGTDVKSSSNFVIFDGVKVGNVDGLSLGMLDCDREGAFVSEADDGNSEDVDGLLDGKSDGAPTSRFGEIKPASTNRSSSIRNSSWKSLKKIRPFCNSLWGTFLPNSFSSSNKLWGTLPPNSFSSSNKGDVGGQPSHTTAAIQIMSREKGVLEGEIKRDCWAISASVMIRL